ncbi:MAG: polysaccharide deacetylase family protein [Thermodesulfovibrio sp.]|nr:polysaccharide deacetylase family protein [Thermodesulfovibrio sp.]
MRLQKIMKTIIRKVKTVETVMTDALMTAIGTITHVETQDRVAALTFDDGPHHRYTPRLLSILERHNAKATFFVVGEAASLHPDLLRQIAEAGHAIGNHSWSHQSFPLLTRAERQRQLHACQAAIKPYGCKLFRPPYGHQTLGSLFEAFVLGYRVVTWNAVGEDWHDRAAAFIGEKIIGEIRPGSVILLHDALFNFAEERHADREATLAAVEHILQRLGSEFTFVTVPELFKYGRPGKVIWRREPDDALVKWLESLRRSDSASFREGDPACWRGN